MLRISCNFGFFSQRLFQSNCKRRNRVFKTYFVISKLVTMSKHSSVRNKTQAKASKEDCRLKEQTSLGKWDEEQIVTCFQEENNNVLHQSVLEAGKDFFFPKALQEIAGLDINDQLNPDSHFGKKRLFLHVGRMNALDSVFQNVRFSCGSKTAYDFVLNFYMSVFETYENKFIEEKLQKRNFSTY